MQCRCAVQALCPHSITDGEGDFHPWGEDTAALRLSVLTAGHGLNPRTLGDVFDDTPSVTPALVINNLFFGVNITPKKSEGTRTVAGLGTGELVFPIRCIQRRDIWVCAVQGWLVTQGLGTKY